MKIVMATGNPGKVKEFRELLKGLPLEILSLKDFENIEEVAETGTTFLENSCQKVIGYAEQTGLACVADDSGLCVDALDGAPGIYSARFAQSDREKCQKLLDLMKDKENRKARFMCCATLWLPCEWVEKIKNNQSLDFDIINDHVISCKGSLEGEIAWKMKGERGFGFDPVFYVPGYHKHLAELSPETKNQISHRGQAMRKIKKILEMIK